MDFPLEFYGRALLVWRLPLCGTALFALLALGGDLGCSSGPTLVGLVSGIEGDLRRGIFVALGFPILLLGCLTLGKKTVQRY